MTDPRNTPLPMEAVALLGDGRVIEAIKLLRRHEPVLGLKEAKDRIDAHIARNPALREQLETRQRAARRTFFFWFLLIDAGIAAGLIYWFFYRGSH